MIIKRIKKWLCKKLGHVYNGPDMLMLAIKMSAENAKGLRYNLKCKRCKDIVDLGNFTNAKETILNAKS